MSEASSEGDTPVDAAVDASGDPPRDAPADAPDAPEQPAEAPAPGPARSRRGLRLGILGALLVLTIVGAIVFTRARHRAISLASDGSGGGSGVALRAPEGPNLAGDPGGVRLTGFVIDGLGTPVAGAEVSAELEKGAADKALAPAPSATSATPVDAAPPTDAATPAPRIWGNAPPAPPPGVHVSPVTGADGRFVIGGLQAGRYRLRVSGAGLLPAEVRYVPVPSDATRIVVARQVAIEGVVTDGGKPAGNVTVGLRGDAIGGALEMRADLAGKFTFAELPEGRYQLFAWQGALAARTVRVNRLGTGPFEAVELRLEAAAIVVGRVIDRDEGTGLVAAIELRPTGDDQAPRYARSGDDGVFRIEGVPNGRWIADAFAPGYVSTGGVELEAGRGVPELSLSRGAMIEGRIVDGEGRPIAGATVRTLGTGATPSETSALVDQDMLRRFSGRMAAPTSPTAGVAGADPGLIPRGELGILVGPIPPIPPPGAQIARPADLDPSNPTMAALAGEPAPLLVDPARASIWTTGSDGRYRIRGLAKGKVAVLAVATGFAEGRSKQLTVDTGQALTDIDVVLTPGTIIVGKITDQHGAPVIGAQVDARPEVGAPMTVFTDDTGAYTLGPLTGDLVLSAVAYGHGQAKKTIELPVAKGATAAEHREDFVLLVADATLAGTLDDANGTPVAGAHLEIVGGVGEGRSVVVGADGTFSLDMLPAGSLRVLVRHPDYPPTELDAIATTAGRASARLRLALGGAIEGAVIEASSGAPIASLVIAAAGPLGGTAEATTDKLGRWKLGPLRPGHWRLKIKVPGYLPLEREVDVTASRTPGGTTVRDVRLELARGALVGGTVRDARGQRVVGATVSVRLANGAPISVEGSTDNMGEFRIRDVPTGEVSIMVTKGDAGGSARATVRPGDEILGLAIDIR